jgi:hypothetical protein
VLIFKLITPENHSLTLSRTSLSLLSLFPSFTTNSIIDIHFEFAEIGLSILSRAGKADLGWHCPMSGVGVVVDVVWSAIRCMLDLPSMWPAKK